MGLQDGTSQLYDVLIAWVEKGVAPSRIDISTVADDDLSRRQIQAHLRLPEESNLCQRRHQPCCKFTCALEESGGRS